jgi:putative drug exporter of the RND superfamily
VIILLLAFGSVIAMVLPMVTAIAAVATSFGLLDLLSHQLTVPSFAPELAALVGLGVGIDYGLFVVTSYRGARDAGAAAPVAGQRSGHRCAAGAGGAVPVAAAGVHRRGHEPRLLHLTSGL